MYRSYIFCRKIYECCQLIQYMLQRFFSQYIPCLIQNICIQDEIDIELSSVPADGAQSIDGNVKSQANPRANLHLLLSRQVTIVDLLSVSDLFSLPLLFYLNNLQQLVNDMLASEVFYFILSDSITSFCVLVSFILM